VRGGTNFLSPAAPLDSKRRRLRSGERRGGRNHPVIALIGDGSFQVSLEHLYPGVRRKATLAPRLDLLGISVDLLRREERSREKLDDLAVAYRAALAQEGVTAPVAPITSKLKPPLGLGVKRLPPAPPVNAASLISGQMAQANRGPGAVERHRARNPSRSMSRLLRSREATDRGSFRAAFLGTSGNCSVRRPTGDIGLIVI